ncbi:MAG: glutamate racemase [Chloroflexi bacterium HGW-Chloroflexi-8]|nr:MAG: glutamate racemase [Chloroflexi bacterium HGW-Chloroflexi-8]
MNAINQFYKNGAIGVFDSGIGGLSVLSEIRKALPDVNLIYFGDQDHVPYGPRELSQVLGFSMAITEFLLSLGSKMIVVACNTASAAALKELRETYSEMPFVGMEPAIKPAVEQTLSGAVGVLATPATFQSKLYASVIERFATGVEIYQDTCPGLVQEIEKGNFNGKVTTKILNKALYPMLEKNIDSIVLGCTHYPYVISLIKFLVGPDVRVINPAPAVARQTKKIFSQIIRSGNPELSPTTTIITSGDEKKLRKKVRDFFPYENSVMKANWIENQLVLNVTQ